MLCRLAFAFFWCFFINASYQLFLYPTTTSSSIIIKKAQPSDFDAIKALWIKSFAHAYELTTQEQINSLLQQFQPYFDAEIGLLNENQQDCIALVATHDNKIIGYLSVSPTQSPHEIYGRCLVIDQDFQNQKITYKLFAYCYNLIPTTKRVICLTRKTNIDAQKLYDHLGGKKEEYPSWLHHLPSSSLIKPNEWVGYSFDEVAIKNCCSRNANNDSRKL